MQCRKTGSLGPAGARGGHALPWRWYRVSSPTRCSIRRSPDCSASATIEIPFSRCGGAGGERGSAAGGAARRAATNLRERALHQRRPLVLPLPAVDKLVQFGAIPLVARARLGRHRAESREEAATAFEPERSSTQGAAA